ncbi:MAG: hypothetical protein Q9227_003569 [Pyrenula ochraceoflavens]
MSYSAFAIAKLLFPYLPLILKTTILNLLNLSPNSTKQNLQTELVVTVLKAILQKRAPISKAQRIGCRDPGIKGPIWISKTTFTKPKEENVQDAVFRAIRELGDGQETYCVPGVSAVEGEWTGHRKDVASKEPRPDLPEDGMYKKLMADVTSDLTITGARVFSARYRLAPQNPFPAALVDALVCYLSLLSPPPGSFHDAVPANRIIFCGDSAGGNLALVLLQTLMTLQRLGIESIQFNGKDIPIEIPAAVSGFSPWCDIGRTQPSIWDNEKYDFLVAPSRTGLTEPPPPDNIWPAKPQRVELYCDGSVVCHPLISPLAALPALWEGSPPIYMCVGTEALQDECLVTARRMHKAGVPVFLDYLEGMPHCSAMMFPKNPMSKKCYADWKDFVQGALEGTLERRDAANWIQAKTFKETHPPFEDLTSISDTEVDQALVNAQRWRMDKEEQWRNEASNEMPKAKL